MSLRHGDLARFEQLQHRLQGELSNRVGRNDLAQQGDHFRIGDQGAAASSRKAVRLGQRSQYRQVWQLLEVPGQALRRREFDVSLIHDHHRATGQLAGDPQDRRLVQQVARGVVG